MTYPATHPIFNGGKANNVLFTQKIAAKASIMKEL